MSNHLNIMEENTTYLQVQFTDFIFDQKNSLILLIILFTFVCISCVFLITKNSKQERKKLWGFNVVCLTNNFKVSDENNAT